MGAEGPQPAKRACLPQGLEVGARSAPQLLVYIYIRGNANVLKISVLTGPLNRAATAVPLISFR